MAKVLVVYFTQTGQLRDILDATLAPLKPAGIEIETIELKPLKSFPFPWPFWTFFDTFPECVHEDPPPIEPPRIAADDFDLVVLAYQVWFLSPSLPVMAFLRSPEGRELLAGKRVITLIGCRNMWLSAQERMKARITELGARLIDNIVLTDSAHSAFTFISTPLWMLTGKRGPFLAGKVPAAGVSAEDIAACARFGRAIAAALPAREKGDDRPMLGGLGAVTIREGLISSELLARRSFVLWGALLRAVGKPGVPLRRAVLVIYILFLLTLILTVAPLTAVIRSLLKPLRRADIARQRAYFAAPSGESRELIA